MAIVARILMVAWMVVWAIGCRGTDEHCSTAPPEDFLRPVAWPGNFRSPSHYFATVESVEQTALHFSVEEPDGEDYQLALDWLLPSAPPFSTGQRVEVLDCRASGLNSVPVVVVRDESGAWLYAGGSGGWSFDRRCLPAEITIDTVDEHCPHLSSTVHCPEAWNVGLRFTSDRESVTLWAGERSQIETAGRTISLLNVFSFMENQCATDSSPIYATYMMAVVP